MIYLGLLVVILILTYIAFVSFYPTFGGDVSKERKIQYAASKNFKNGQFVNVKDVPKDPSFSEILTMTRKFFFTKVENANPNKDLKVQKIDSAAITDYNSPTRLIWFGHSSFLLQMEGQNILIDPMFGDVPAPHPWLGNRRFSKVLPIEIEELPTIDAVLISHDHYDHLDYGSIKRLKNKVEMFYTPLGVGVHLQAWGIESERIVELDWWQDVSFKGLDFVCTPAQHFSGRKFSNRQSTLWASWVIKSDNNRIFFSGDSGYAPHFKEIGEKYGPFDFAMLECGQYNPMWPDVHMFPEETAQASIDLKAAHFMPIHWGAFKLAMHSWTDPAERVAKKAEELNISVLFPEIGEEIVIDSLQKNTNYWWK